MKCFIGRFVGQSCHKAYPAFSLMDNELGAAPFADDKITMAECRAVIDVFWPIMDGLAFFNPVA